MRKKLWQLAAFTGLLLAGCSGTDLQSDFDKEADFSGYRTFTVCLSDMDVESEGRPAYDNERNRNLVRAAIEAEMKQRGYTETDSAPELQAGFHIAIEDKQVSFQNCSGRVEYNYWPECRMETYRFTEGTLIIYVTDLKKNQIIWQGSLSGVLSEADGNDEKLIGKIVTKIFERFPVAADSTQ